MVRQRARPSGGRLLPDSGVTLTGREHPSQASVSLSVIPRGQYSPVRTKWHETEVKGAVPSPGEGLPEPGLGVALE